MLRGRPFVTPVAGGGEPHKRLKNEFCFLLIHVIALDQIFPVEVFVSRDVTWRHSFLPTGGPEEENNHEQDGESCSPGLR